MRRISLWAESRFSTVFPPLRWLPSYERSWLRFDAIAGLTLAAYVIPVSLAYASLDGGAVISKEGKPVVGITFPDDWKQTTGENYISAVSSDGKAYSMLVTLDGITDKQAGVKKVRLGLESYLQGIEFDDPTETKGGAQR